jgi:hypothetical protein
MKNYSPLSKVQYGIYAECVGHAGEICYNLPYLYILDKSLDEERLRCAVEETVKAHPTLFTRIELNDEGGLADLGQSPMPDVKGHESFEISRCLDVEMSHSHRTRGTA